MATSLSPRAPEGSVGHVLDEAPSSLFHLKTAVTSGMGFFTDAYDLNVISTALLLIKPQFHLSAGQVGLVGSTALIASLAGAFAFGPNAGTMVFAAESFPVSVRTTGHGLSAGIAKAGAYLGARRRRCCWRPSGSGPPS